MIIREIGITIARIINKTIATSPIPPSDPEVGPNIIELRFPKKIRIDPENVIKKLLLNSLFLFWYIALNIIVNKLMAIRPIQKIITFIEFNEL